METKPCFSPQGRLTSPAGDRMNFIDMANFIGIVLVVWGHSHPISSDWWGTWYSDWNAFIYSFHMQLFFFVGGYLMVFSKSIDQLGFKGWAMGKLKKFLVPYFVLTFLAYYPKSLLGGTSDVVEFSLGYLLETTFLVPRLGVWGHFWFIATFLTVELYFGLWRANAKEGRVLSKVLFGIGTVGCLFLILHPIYTDYLMLDDLRFHAIFYPLGIVTAMAKPILWDKPWKNILGILLPLLPAIPLYPYGNYRVDSWPLANFALSMLLIWSVWNLAILFGKNRYPLVRFLVRDSFTVFVYSWPAQAVVDVILRRLGVYWVAIIPCLFITGFVFPLLLANCYRKLTIFHCKFLDALLGITTIIT